MSNVHEQLQAYLFKKKLNQMPLIDMLSNLSEMTVKGIIGDFNVEEKHEDLTPKLYVFSDGNVKSNGQKGARGGYSVYFGDVYPFSKFNKTRIISLEPTNNKAELSGIRQIFKTIYQNQELFTGVNVVICTDSQYSINCIQKWSTSWEKTNWKNSKGEDVKNQVLIKEILMLRTAMEESIQINFKHVFGHTKEPVNKTSLDWKLWHGNWKVDSDINTMLN